MEDFARGVGVNEKENTEAQRSAITEIDFKFSKGNCVLSITVHGQASQKFKINYEEANFKVSLEKPLKALGLGLLDFTSVNNLYQIKLVDQLLINVLKKGMQKINKFCATKIYNFEKEKTIQNLVKSANNEDSAILEFIKEKFEKINTIIEEVQMEVYDRSLLIKKANEEIVDNLNRKYILVVNQLIELQRGHNIPESSLSAQVKELIDNL